MNERAAGRLAWGLFGLAMALAAGAVVFLILGWSTEPPAGAFGFRGFGIVFALVFSATGSVVASRRPANPIWAPLQKGLFLT
ncbi:MAG: hypothetical protein ACR2L4_00985 [Actinomycetota bacterium]